MIFNATQKNCCGCTACASVCPKQCIEMIPDDEGFLIPSVNMDECVGCNLCKKVCPMNINSIKKRGIDSAFIVRNKDKDILNKSSSGGFYSSLCNYVLKNKGYCVGAVFDEQWNVRHIISNEYSDIARFRGSKYIQSDIRGIYPKVKELLECNHLICFSGTPCQVAGLRSFLKKDYENLITVDFVCHGVPSPLLWQHYLLQFAGKNIKYINNRSKRYGYHSSVMQIDFHKGSSYYGSPRTDLALKSFYCNISSRLTCYECPFKGIERYSDFTIWDCWRPDIVDYSIKNDDLGFTNVIVHTKKGKMIMPKLKELYQFCISDDEGILPRNPKSMLTHSTIPHKSRNLFYKNIKVLGLEKTVHKFIPISRSDVIIEWFKRPLSRLGLLYIIKKYV